MVYIRESLLAKKTPLQCILHCLFGLLGAFWHPFFHTLHLILIYLMSNTAYYVVRSITTHIGQLGITLLLAIFFIYSMAFIVFVNYSRSWDGQVDNDGSIPMCRDMWECLMYVINLGLRNGGGIADSHGTYNSQEDTWGFLAKTLFDLIFFILVNVISLNIIFGIIIDTFASMRDENARKTEILFSKCIVCGESRDTIERKGETFDYHVQFRHNIWKYLFYQVYLEASARTELTGVENSLHDHIIIERGDQWIPQSKLQEDALRIEQYKMIEIINSHTDMLGKILERLPEPAKADANQPN